MRAAMSSFSSLLSSINGKPSAQPTVSTANSKPGQAPAVTGRPEPQSNESRLVANNTAAGIKRRSDDLANVVRPKSIRVESDREASRPVATTLAGTSATTVAYRGTARAPKQSNAPTPISRPLSRPGGAPAVAPPNASAQADNAAKPKRGFASVMEKAKAAQEAAKAQGNSGIKHKPVEKLSRREKSRLQEETAANTAKSKPGVVARGSKPVAVGSGSKVLAQKKAPETSYKGTMKKQSQALSYKGTMGSKPAGSSAPRKPVQKGLGQDKYGGYASWSDLDDAEGEEDEEGDYESDVSSDMEGGFDEVEREETAALRSARKEDQAALEEEERHRREKQERKRKLLELSKSAAAKKRY